MPPLKSKPMPKSARLAGSGTGEDFDTIARKRVIKSTRLPSNRMNLVVLIEFYLPSFVSGSRSMARLRTEPEAGREFWFRYF